VRVIFTPTASGSQTGTITFSAVSGGGGSVGASGAGTAVSVSGTLAVFAGVPSGVGSADGTGVAARFNYPFGVAVDGAGNIYVADNESCTIRKITSAGVVTTLAGTAGLYGSADGTGAAAKFYGPKGIAVDGTGNLYVADTGNNTIRKITPAGVVTTVAGSAGSTGSADGTGAAARFNGPEGIALDGAGNLYVADMLNNAIRKITRSVRKVIAGFLA
jgi:hypothetical protein